MPGFRGFPPEALEFLRDLEANNDRDWFKANRARYDEHIVGPVRALGDDVAWDELTARQVELARQDLVEAGAVPRVPR